MGWVGGWTAVEREVHFALLSHPHCPLTSSSKSAKVVQVLVWGTGRDRGWQARGTRNGARLAHGLPLVHGKVAPCGRERMAGGASPGRLLCIGRPQALGRISGVHDILTLATGRIFGVQNILTLAT